MYRSIPVERKLFGKPIERETEKYGSVGELLLVIFLLFPLVFHAFEVLLCFFFVENLTRASLFVLELSQQLIFIQPIDQNILHATRAIIDHI